MPIPIFGKSALKEQKASEENPYHPWDCYIYLQGMVILVVNVSKYTSPMDAMGMEIHFLRKRDLLQVQDIFLGRDVSERRGEELFKEEDL